MKKEIEQEFFPNIEILLDDFGHIEISQLCINSLLKNPTVKEDLISVENNSRTTVAKAICPKYQEIEDRNNDLEAENSALLDLHYIDTEEIKELKDQYAKLLEALKKTIDHVLNRAMKIDIEATIELIQQSETK